MLIFVEGPAGGGKSRLLQDMQAAGEIDVALDVTQLWAATGGYERGPDGKYPVRAADDLSLHVARYVQTAAAGFALREGYNIAVTTSQRGQVGKWAAMAAENGAEFSVRTIDPGEDVVRERLTDPETGILDDECEAAIGRWFK